MEYHEKDELKTIGAYLIGVAIFAWGMICFVPTSPEQMPGVWQTAAFVPGDNISWPVFAILGVSFVALLYFLNRDNK